mgnify:FL=1
MNDEVCRIIERINRRLMNGEDPERVIPYDVSGFPPQVRRELGMLYIKFGGDERRKAVVREKLRHESW